MCNEFFLMYSNTKKRSQKIICNESVRKRWKKAEYDRFWIYCTRNENFFVCRFFYDNNLWFAKQIYWPKRYRNENCYHDYRLNSRTPLMEKERYAYQYQFRWPFLIRNKLTHNYANAYSAFGVQSAYVRKYIHRRKDTQW